MLRTTLLATFVAALALTVVAGAALPQQDAQPLDREFLIKAMTCNHAEIKVSELAELRTNNEKVKQFAKKLVKDHEASRERLTELATAHKLAILTGTEKETKELISRFTNLANAGFDREYIQYVIDEHEKAIRMCEAQAKRGSDTKLSAFATEMLPTLRAHLAEAKKLATENGQ